MFSSVARAQSRVELSLRLDERAAHAATQTVDRDRAFRPQNFLHPSGRRARLVNGIRLHELRDLDA